MVRANHASGLDDARARIHQITGTQSDALFSVLKLEKPLALFAATPDPIVLLPALLNTLRDQTATVTLSSHHPHLRPIWQEKFADIDNLTISEAPWGNGKETIYYELKGQSLSLLRAPNPVYETWLYGYSDWMQPLLEKPVKTRSLKTDRGDGQMDALFLGMQGNEKSVLDNAGPLEDVLMIEVQVPYDPYFLDQDLFHSIDAFLRSHGFYLHRQFDADTKTIAPMILQNQSSHGINQIISKRSVYIPSPERIVALDRAAKKKLLFLSHYFHGSLDLSQRLCLLLDQEEPAQDAKITPMYNQWLKTLLLR